jgi:hypothetical protein
VVLVMGRLERLALFLKRITRGVGIDEYCWVGAGFL